MIVHWAVQTHGEPQLGRHDMWEFRIETEHSRHPIAGGDTVIAHLPEDMFATFHHTTAVAVSALLPRLRQAASASAHALGETLHSAVAVITRDPDVVRDWGVMPEHADCKRCQQAVANALAVLAADPATEMIVMRCYWAAAPGEPVTTEPPLSAWEIAKFMQNEYSRAAPDRNAWGALTERQQNDLVEVTGKTIARFFPDRKVI